MSFGYTGRLYEREVLGSCKVAWDGKSYVAYDEALHGVIEGQPWDPRDPTPRAASDLHASIALALGIEDWSKLGLFTAVGSPLDFFHGIDGFIAYRGRYVTFDVTTNPHKDEAKADFVVTEDDLNQPDLIARLIASKLISPSARSFTFIH